MPLASLALLLLLAPLLPGVATRTRAVLTGRRGAPVLQLYFDLAKLWRKGVVYSTTTTWIFRLAPVAVTVTAILAACLLPLDGREAVVSFSGDLDRVRLPAGARPVLPWCSRGSTPARASREWARAAR